jgi:transcriptional regulator with XRE-family HTH domain
VDEKFSIGSKIWQTAKSQRFTKAALAKALNVSRQTLDNWINGVTDPGYDDLNKASKLLDAEFLNPEKKSQDEPIKVMPLDVWDRLQRNFDSFEQNFELNKSEILFLREMIRGMMVGRNIDSNKV